MNQNSICCSNGWLLKRLQKLLHIVFRNVSIYDRGAGRQYIGQAQIEEFMLEEEGAVLPRGLGNVLDMLFLMSAENKKKNPKQENPLN